MAGSKHLAGLACALAAVIAACPLAAQAAWIRAETDRFIVYGDGRDKAVRDLAVRLTAYDATLRVFNPRTAKAPIGRKLEVYLVDSGRELRRDRKSVV